MGSLHINGGARIIGAGKRRCRNWVFGKLRALAQHNFHVLRIDRKARDRSAQIAAFFN